MDRDSFLAEFRAELRRIGLDPDELQALAVGEDPAHMLVRLRTLPVGSAWSDVFPGTPAGWSPSQRPPERSLGPFDHQAPPRGIAIIAVLEPGEPEESLDRAIARARTLGYPIYGAGAILDRGHPHLYIVLPLGASEDDAYEIAEALRDRDGIGNAYPVRGTRFADGA